MGCLWSVSRPAPSSHCPAPKPGLAASTTAALSSIRIDSWFFSYNCFWVHLQHLFLCNKDLIAFASLRPALKRQAIPMKKNGKNSVFEQEHASSLHPIDHDQKRETDQRREVDPNASACNHCQWKQPDHIPGHHCGAKDKKPAQCGSGIERERPVGAVIFPAQIAQKEKENDCTDHLRQAGGIGTEMTNQPLDEVENPGIELPSVGKGSKSGEGGLSAVQKWEIAKSDYGDSQSGFTPA